jgi:hypothetical protein
LFNIARTVFLTELIIPFFFTKIHKKKVGLMPHLKTDILNYS